MVRRIVMASVSASVALTALPAAAAHGQVPIASTLPRARVAMMPISPGTGPFSVVLKTSSGATAFGNATAITFTRPTASAVIQFAPNDQMAAAIKQNACLVQQCAANLTVNYSTTKGPASYTLEHVRLTQVQSGTGLVATFTFTSTNPPIELKSFQFGVANPTSTATSGAGGGDRAGTDSLALKEPGTINPATLPRYTGPLLVPPVGQPTDSAQSRPAH